MTWCSFWKKRRVQGQQLPCMLHSQTISHRRSTEWNHITSVQHQHGQHIRLSHVIVTVWGAPNVTLPLANVTDTCV